MSRTTTGAPAASRAVEAGHRDLRLFVFARDQTRVRRPLDVIVAAVSIGLLVPLAWWFQPARVFERSLSAAVTSSPAWLHNLWVVAYDVLALLAAGVAAAILARRRWPLLAQCA